MKHSVNRSSRLLGTDLLPPVLGYSLFQRLAERYLRATGFSLSVTDATGRLLARSKARKAKDTLDNGDLLRSQAIAEAARWGEPCVLGDGVGRVCWAVPVMANQVLLGGLVVSGVPLIRPRRPGTLDRRVTKACRLLLDLAVEQNLVNCAELGLRRADAEREREKAEAVHALKASCYDDLRSIYLREEPALLSAIRRGERAEARAAINRVLACLYHVGGKRTDLLKSLALELVVMMARAAVQAGGNPTKILGLNYQSLTTLSKVSDQEALASWLGGMLEQLIDALQAHNGHPNAVQLVRAFDFMAEHLADDLTREQVARAAGLSPGHFSHLMRAKAGLSFTQLHTRLRVDRASQLMLRTSRNLAEIALECGFADQSYFTRVFRRQTGKTPGEFRKLRASAPKS